MGGHKKARPGPKNRYNGAQMCGWRSIYARRLTIFAVLLLVALPSVLYGRWIKDKVYLQTDSVGKVEFSHYVHMEKGESCGTCHDGSMGFSVVEDCDACHEM